MILKTFFEDFFNLNVFQFGRKYFLPIIGTFATLAIIGQSYMYSLDPNKLLVVSGKIIKIDDQQEIIKNKYKKNKFLFLTLDNLKTYRLHSNNFEKQITYLTDNIKVGDYVSITHRKKFQSFIGFGHSEDIFQIEKDSNILLSLNTTKSVYLRNIFFMIFISSLSWFIYYYYHLRKIKRSTHN